MFKNEYQGGNFVEVFGASGKDPLGKLKNHHIKREFDKDVKGYIYLLEGSTTKAKLHLPVDSRQTLGLIQRYLSLQIYVPLSKDFTVGLTVTDIKNNKRRMVLSTSFKDMSSTLHAKVPLTLIKRDVWLNLCLDLVSLTSGMFVNETFKALEEFTINGTCKVRRVFTLKCPPPDTSDIGDDPNVQHVESIPSSLQFTNTVKSITQVISLNKIRCHLPKKETHCETRDTSGYWSSSEDLHNLRKLSAREQTHTHIAFGTKVQFESPRLTSRRNGPSSARAENVQSSRSSDAYNSLPSARKVHSSKARLPSQNLSHKPTSVGSDAQSRVTSSKYGKQVNRKPLKPPNVTAIGQELRQPPFSLISLVDELELSESLGSADLEYEVAVKNGSKSDGLNGSTSSVFKFSSHPHSVPREPTPSNDNIENGTESLSYTELPEHESIQQRIIRNTPTPRAAISVSPKTIKQLQNAKHRHLLQPQSSLSPDISVMYSQSSQLYDSARYTDSMHKFSQSPPMTKSIMSLKSSDATLTESIDTLVQSSLSETNNISLKPDKKSRVADHLASGVVPQFNGSQTSVIVNRKSVRELPGSPENVRMPESSHFQVGTWSESFEAQMLESMKRGVEEDMVDMDEDADKSDEVNYQAKFEDSFNTSWGTYNHPPSMHPQAYDFEMKDNYPAGSTSIANYTLDQSNPREWANLLSPPTVLPSVRAQQKKESVSDAESLNNDYDVMGLSDGSSSVSIKSSTTTGDTDDEEMLDLLYDPCLNCYFDPKSGKYYELKN